MFVAKREGIKCQIVDLSYITQSLTAGLLRPFDSSHLSSLQL